MRVQPFGFEKELVLQLIGKLDDLVFNARAVARANGLDLSRIHRRVMNVLRDNTVSLGWREGDVAGHLPLLDVFGTEAERRRVGIARLHLKARPVNAASIEARRRAGLEAASAQAQQLERFAQQLRWRLTRAPRRISLLATVNQSVEKCSRGDDNGLRADAPPVPHLEPKTALRARVLSTHYSVLRGIFFS